MRLFSEKTSLLLEAKLEKFNPKNKSEQKGQLSVLSGTIAMKPVWISLTNHSMKTQMQISTELKKRSESENRTQIKPVKISLHILFPRLRRASSAVFFLLFIKRWFSTYCSALERKKRSSMSKQNWPFLYVSALFSFNSITNQLLKHQMQIGGKNKLNFSLLHFIFYSRLSGELFRCDRLKVTGLKQAEQTLQKPKYIACCWLVLGW